MQIFTSQQLRQKQSLVITTQLQQAIRLLQMSNLELRAFLDQQAEENPFIEVAEGERDAPILAPEAPQATAEAAPEAIDAPIGAAAIPDDGPICAEGYANTFETDRIDLGTGGRRRDDEGDDFDAISGSVAQGERSLYDHVATQIDLIFAHPAERIIALALADGLEPTGWLGPSVDEVAMALGVPGAEVEAVLKRLQGIEPAGIFARNLAECLRLQAAERGMLTPAFAALLENLPLLASGNMKSLARTCGVDADALREMLRALRTLDPKPGMQFEQGAEPITPPDLIVRRGPDGWIVDLNRSTLPSVRVNRGFAQSVLAGKAANPAADAARGFARERVSDANWLRRAIAQRNATTLRIGAEIVRQQEAFLEKGLGHLRPLVLRDVAEAVGVHESTVSRVTSGLMMATPLGTFRLKTFFSVGLPSSTSGEGADAASAVKFRIRKLIEGEPADAPYSDDAIVRMMKAEGVNLARRTAAKYREMLNIPSSFARRRKAVMAGQV